MTLQELHDTTKQLLDEGVDPGLKVITEGCDCEGVAGALEVYPAGQWSNEPFVYITRQ